MSAPGIDECDGMDGCDDKHPASATKRDFVLEQKDGKPGDARDVQAGAKERVVDRELGQKAYERRILVRDSRAGSCPTEKPCMLLDQQKKNVACDLSSNVLSVRKPDSLLTFHQEVLKPIFC